MRRLLLYALAVLPAACGEPRFGRSATSPVMMAPADPTLRPLPRPDVPAAEKAAAGAALGQVSVVLGSPAEQGFWLRSALIRTPGKGRVELPDGASVAVDLRPGEGAALLSFAAYRALGLALTDLPVVTVYAE